MGKKLLLSTDGELIAKHNNQEIVPSGYFRPENVFLMNPAHLELVMNKGLVKKKKRSELTQSERIFPWWFDTLSFIFVLLLIIAAFYNSSLVGVLVLVSILLLLISPHAISHKKTRQVKRMLNSNAQLLRGQIVDFSSPEGRDSGYTKYSFTNPGGVKIIGTTDGTYPHYSVIKTYRNRWQQKTVKIGTNVAVLYINDRWHMML